MTLPTVTFTIVMWEKLFTNITKINISPLFFLTKEKKSRIVKLYHNYVKHITPSYQLNQNKDYI